MKEFQRAEHRAVAKALRAMDHDLLARNHCWFGGGTEIVLDLGEYRLSRDMDFLCADTDGYRAMRSLAVTGGAKALFGDGVSQERAFRADQYGIRGIIGVDGCALRFEIIREARIGLEGRPDRDLGVPRLTETDRIAEKLLANADRCQDRSTSFRDAVDLGMIAACRGRFHDDAWTKAFSAYGDDVADKLSWALGCLAEREERHRTAATLGMAADRLDTAIASLAIELQIRTARSNKELQRREGSA